MTNRQVGDSWTEAQPGGQTATHTYTGAETVDTTVQRADNTWSDIRTYDDGQGTTQVWADERAYETLIAGWQPRRPNHTATAAFRGRSRGL